MKVHRTIRYRVHPRTQAKAHKLAGTAGACRFVWNHFVAKLRDEYKAYGRSNYRFYTLGKQFTLLRKYCEPWLQEYSANIVKSSLKPIETNYRQFFKEEGGLPSFKAKYVHAESFPLSKGLFSIRGHHLHIQKIGELLLLGHNPYPDAIPVSGTVKKECGKWYAYIVYEVGLQEALKPVEEVGIDRNVGQITCSDGVVYRLPNIERLEARRRRCQRMMARRRCGSRKHKRMPSNRYMRAKHMHAITSRKIRQIRSNWCHHVSRKIASKYSLVHLEKLNVRGMTKRAKGTADEPGKNVRAKSGLNRVILGSCWGKLHQCLDYKTNTNYINPANTSITCNKCGHVDAASRISQSVFICTACGHRDNADRNAALNIKASGNGASARGDGGVTRSMKREIGI